MAVHVVNIRVTVINEIRGWLHKVLIDYDGLCVTVTLGLDTIPDLQVEFTYIVKSLWYAHREENFVYMSFCLYVIGTRAHMV